jgi:hypothetical protein
MIKNFLLALVLLITTAGVSAGVSVGSNIVIESGTLVCFAQTSLVMQTNNMARGNNKLVNNCHITKYENLVTLVSVLNGYIAVKTVKDGRLLYTQGKNIEIDGREWPFI